MTPIPSYVSIVEIMHGLVSGTPLPSKPSLGAESSEFGQSMSGISLEPNGLNLLCDEYIKVLNKLMEGI